MRSMMNRRSPEHDRSATHPNRGSTGAWEYVTYDSDAEDGWRPSPPSPEEEDIAVIDPFVSAAPYSKTERKWLHTATAARRRFFAGLDSTSMMTRTERKVVGACAR